MASPRPIEPEAQRVGLPGRPAHAVITAPASSALSAASVAYKNFEQWLRCAYLRTIPRPVVARIDPPLRRTFAIARRVAAIPLYLHQPLSVWRGRCSEETATVVLWGKPESPRPLFDILFETTPAVRWYEPQRLPAILRPSTDLLAGADLLIAETTPALAPAFRRHGFLVVPSAVRFGGAPRVLDDTLAHANKSLRSDLRRVQRAKYRAEMWPYTEARSRLFYDRYKLPHAQVRFRDAARWPRFESVDRLFRCGCFVTLSRPGQDAPDVMALIVTRGDVAWFVTLGTRDGDPAVLHAGGVAALYEFVIRLAHQRGLRFVDAGRCRPWRSDGVASYKWKWGLRPMEDTALTLAHAVKVLRPESAAARRLAECEVIVQSGADFLVMSPNGLLSAR